VCIRSYDWPRQVLHDDQQRRTQTAPRACSRGISSANGHAGWRRGTQPAGEQGQCLLGEAGTDVAGVGQAAGAVHADQQGADLAGPGPSPRR
jgi:hypothetical protein